MKFGVLRSIGHNTAHSLASGLSLMVGQYDSHDIFHDAAVRPEGYILVDFLLGTSSGGQPSAAVARVIPLYARVLPDLCRRHGTTISAFGKLTTRYFSLLHIHRFIVTVEDRTGRRSIDEYVGRSGQRVMELDDQGRVRPKRSTFLMEAN